MTNVKLIDSLASVEKIASMSKLGRMINHPAKYLFSIFYREFIYPFSKKEIVIKTKLFNGSFMTIALPASTDIFLCGGKSHVSEIRLARFLIKNLHSNSIFIDVGAHYGYFSLIASQIVKDGKVYSIEPSLKSFNILKKNMCNMENTVIFHHAVSKESGSMFFYEFDNLHSEYNSTEVAQFENEKWFKAIKPKPQKVDAICLTDFCMANAICPDFIKIDVEGFENEVIKGAENLLTSSKKKPVIIMEYLEPKRRNVAHKEAFSLLSKWGYLSYIIDDSGSVSVENDIDNYLLENSLESDNVVFVAKEE